MGDTCHMVRKTEESMERSHCRGKQSLRTAFRCRSTLGAVSVEACLVTIDPLDLTARFNGMLGSVALQDVMAEINGATAPKKKDRSRGQ